MLLFFLLGSWNESLFKYDPPFFCETILKLAWRLQNIKLPKRVNCAKSVAMKKKYLTELRSHLRYHLGGTNPFSCKWFPYIKWLIGFCQVLAQVRRLILIGWFFLYKQPLRYFIWIYTSVKRYSSACHSLIWFWGFFLIYCSFDWAKA